MRLCPRPKLYGAVARLEEAKVVQVFEKLVATCPGANESLDIALLEGLHAGFISQALRKLATEASRPLRVLQAQGPSDHVLGRRRVSRVDLGGPRSPRPGASPQRQASPPSPPPPSCRCSRCGAPAPPLSTWGGMMLCWEGHLVGGSLSASFGAQATSTLCPWEL